MNLEESFVHIDIDLNHEDQKKIDQCIKQQEQLDTLGKKANSKLNSTKIFGVDWKYIWKNEIVNPEDRDIKKLRVPLSKK